MHQLTRNVIFVAGAVGTLVAGQPRHSIRSYSGHTGVVPLQSQISSRRQGRLLLEQNGQGVKSTQKQSVSPQDSGIKGYEAIIIGVGVVAAVCLACIVMIVCCRKRASRPQSQYAITYSRRAHLSMAPPSDIPIQDVNRLPEVMINFTNRASVHDRQAPEVTENLSPRLMDTPAADRREHYPVPKSPILAYCCESYPEYLNYTQHQKLTNRTPSPRLVFSYFGEVPTPSDLTISKRPGKLSPQFDLGVPPLGDSPLGESSVRSRLNSSLLSGEQSHSIYINANSCRSDRDYEDINPSSVALSNERPTSMAADSADGGGFLIVFPPDQHFGESVSVPSTKTELSGRRPTTPIQDRLDALAACAFAVQIPKFIDNDKVIQQILLDRNSGSEANSSLRE